MLEHTVSHIRSHTLDCEIQFVFCHREEGEGQGEQIGVVPLREHALGLHLRGSMVSIVDPGALA